MSNPRTYQEIRISNVAEKTKNELCNIASHLNVSVPDIIKSNLHKITEMYPANMKSSPAKKD